MKRHVTWLALLVLAASATAGTAADLTCPAPNGTSCEKADVGYTPQYPDPSTQTAYAVFVATLPGLGYLGDGDDDGSLADERCNKSKKAGLGTGIAAGSTIIALSSGCNVAPENLDSGCFAAMTVLTLALESASIVEAQCNLQDGLVDGAELEAAYENSKMLMASQLELTLDDCSRLGSLFLPRELGGRAEEIRDLTRRRIDQVTALGLTPIAVSRAEEEWALGVSRLAAGEYYDAFAGFCRAYKHLQQAKR